MYLIGIFSALGLLLLALKIGGRKTIGSDIFVDVLITLPSAVWLPLCLAAYLHQLYCSCLKELCITKFSN